MNDDVLRARRLMRRIDDCYERGALRHGHELEQRLECLLWSLEHHLLALDEDEELRVDDGDPDGEVGIEEQFIALWYAYNNGGPSFAGDQQASEGHLLDVLQCACLRGMAPRNLQLGALPPLLPIAAELARERSAFIARYRAHSRRFGR